MQRRTARARIRGDGPTDLDGPTVAGVRVGDDGCGWTKAADHAELGEHGFLRGEAQVRPAEARQRGPGAGHVKRLVAGGEGDACGEPVVDAGGGDDAVGLGEEAAEGGGAAEWGEVGCCAGGVAGGVAVGDAD